MNTTSIDKDDSKEMFVLMPVEWDKDGIEYIMDFTTDPLSPVSVLLKPWEPNEDQINLSLELPNPYSLVRAKMTHFQEPKYEFAADIQQLSLTPPSKNSSTTTKIEELEKIYFKEKSKSESLIDKLSKKKKTQKLKNLKLNFQKKEIKVNLCQTKSSSSKRNIILIFLLKTQN